MKKKKALPIILLVVLLIALVISYSMLKKYNKEQKEATEETSENVISCSSSDIVAISINNKNGDMNFKYDTSGGKWQYADDKAFPLDTSKIESILNTACALSAARHLDDNLDNISEYGLDSPAYTMAMENASGDKTTLYIGNSNSSSGNYYAYIDGKSVVYMIDSTLPKALDCSLYDMATLETFPTINSTDIYKLKIADTQYEYFENGNARYDYTNSNDWFRQNQDGTYTAVDTTSMNTMLSSLTNFEYSKCADYNVTNDELAQYGLDTENAKSIVVEYYEDNNSQSETETDTEETTTENTANKVSQQFILYVGNKNDDGEYYVKSSMGTAVNTVAADKIEGLLNVTDTDLINKNVFSINESIVKSLKATADGKTIDILENGEITDKDKYTDVYNKINAIIAENVITDNSTIVPDSPSLTLTFVLDSEAFPTVTMEFTKYNGSYYQATINGSTQLLVVKSTIEDIVNAIN